MGQSKLWREHCNALVFLFFVSFFVSFVVLFPIISTGPSDSCRKLIGLICAFIIGLHNMVDT